MTDGTPGIRLDIWLWAARFFKTRALAKEAISTGKIALAGQVVAKAARTVRIGDQLQIERAGERYDVSVLGLSNGRVAAPLVATLYSEGVESVARREAAREQRRLQNAGYQAPAHRPDKKARRQIQSLQQPGKGKLPPWFPQ